jgi:3-deoxy-D-manno-octulosonate 8-phosphate phosphatase (KDO 8-P phosphatase)
VTIRAIAMDVDGVLTDGTVALDAAGNESKRISFADIMGVSIGRRVGLRFALISGESGGVLDAIAAKLGIVDVYAGCKDKAAALRDFAARNQLPLSDVCFIGDDVNDVEAMAIAGLGVAPASAQPAALHVASRVTVRGGGAGAVREVIDELVSRTEDIGSTHISEREPAHGVRNT